MVSILVRPAQPSIGHVCLRVPLGSFLKISGTMRGKLIVPMRPYPILGFTESLVMIRRKVRRLVITWEISQMSHRLPESQERHHFCVVEEAMCFYKEVMSK